MTVDILGYKILMKTFHSINSWVRAKSLMFKLLNVTLHPVSHGLCLSFLLQSLENLVKCLKKCMFADLLSLHGGPRKTCNKPRYPVSHINLKIFYFHFAVKRFC